MRVRYSKWPKEGNFFFYTTEPHPEVGRVTNLEPDEVSVELHDLRVTNGMTLKRIGFELVNFLSCQHKEQVIVWLLQLLSLFPLTLHLAVVSDSVPIGEGCVLPYSLLKSLTGADKVVILRGLCHGKVSNEYALCFRLKLHVLPCNSSVSRSHTSVSQSQSHSNHFLSQLW